VKDNRHTHRESELDTEGRKKVPGCAAGVGSNRPMPKGRDNPTGRGDLFDHLSYAPGGRETDSWVGNHLIGTTAVRSQALVMNYESNEPPSHDRRSAALKSLRIRTFP
jgi:hypothetical protein